MENSCPPQRNVQTLIVATKQQTESNFKAAESADDFKHFLTTEEERNAILT